MCEFRERAVWTTLLRVLFDGLSNALLQPYPQIINQKFSNLEKELHSR